MLSFYTDPQMLRPITSATPKLFCCPDEGGTRLSTLYLGNGYKAILASPASSGATTIAVNQTQEFLAGGGTATIAGQVAAITYTGITSDALTGVSGLTVNVSAGASVSPNLTYTVTGNILVGVTGSDALGVSSQIAVCLKTSTQSTYGFRGTPVIFGVSTFASSTPIEIDISITALPGADQIFSSIELLFGGYVTRDASITTALTGSESTSTVSAIIQVDRHDQGLTIFERLFPVNRMVSPNLPGFVVGSYRWRDPSMINAQQILATNWNVDISDIPATSFVSGVADLTDLAPLVVEESENSLYLRIKDGFYFESKIRSYLPSGALLQVVSTATGSQTIQLQNSVAATTPIFVGNWIANQAGQFVAGTQYRYVGHTFDTTQSDNQFTIQRSTGILKLQGAMLPQNVFLGVVSGDAIDYFDVPVYPVGSIPQVYVNQGLNLPNLYSGNFTYDPVAGTMQVPAIAGAVIGQPIFAVCNPGVAVLYAQGAVWEPDSAYVVETVITFNGFLFRASNNGVSQTSTPAFILSSDSITNDNGIEWVCEGPVNTVRALADLNPAFAGISQGYLYLAQAYQGAFTITLSCDKPRIPIPASVTDEIGLIAFGPVYYDGDYALLIATVVDSNGNPVPNIDLLFVPGPNFEGQINYETPSTENPIVVRTGGDGVANLIYTPPSDFGYYLPLASTSTTTVTGDTLDLVDSNGNPTPIAYGQMWNSLDGWLTVLYQVLADNPYYGIVGADTAAGQIEFASTGPSGTPGTSGYVPYVTNGRLVPLLTSGGAAFEPIQALTSTGAVCSAPTDMAVKLVFPSAITGTISVKAYFFSYIERVMMDLQAINSNVTSNSILLQMAPPPLIGDTTPYLILDNLTEGQLDVQRLGYVGADLYFQGTALI